MIATGSYADHVHLTYCLGEYEQAVRIAMVMGNGFFGELADKALERLTKAAVICGHDLGSPSESVFSFSRRRVRIFNREFGVQS